MADAAERRRRRAANTRRRRRRRVAWLAAAVALATAGGVSAAIDELGGDDAAVTTAATPARKARQLPVPPRPIPGYLLIADRGNDRVLLVDGKKRILWRYPRRNLRPRFPFRFDDDAFFGPRFHTIISNQEDQDTLQVISFPGGRLLWRYGHASAPSTAQPLCRPEASSSARSRGRGSTGSPRRGACVGPSARRWRTRRTRNGSAADGSSWPITPGPGVRSS
jgi:hypothetical protein